MKLTFPEMGKYIKKSKLAGDVSVKDISQPTTRATKNLALHRLRSHSNDSDSFNYLQLRSRRLVKLPLLPNTKKQQQQQPQLIQCVHECQTRNPRAKSVPANKLDFESEERGKRETTPCSGNLIRDSKAIQSEIEDFFAYAEKQQQRFFIEKYNFDIVSENPLPGRYEWVKVVP